MNIMKYLTRTHAPRRTGLAVVAAVALIVAAGATIGVAQTIPDEPSTSAAATSDAAPQEQAPALDCAALTPTPAQTEGPYWTPNSPERASLLEPGMAGTRLVIAGYVVTQDCQPVAGALLDFWQADAAGAYDNSGYTLRGHQYTDVNGRFELETVVPGLYPGRTRHIHVKVQAPGGPVLTTQLYFPDEPGNARDGIFRPQALLQNVQETDAGTTAAFTFVIGS